MKMLDALDVETVFVLHKTRDEDFFLYLCSQVVIQFFFFSSPNNFLNIM